MELLLTVGQISKLFNITSESLRHYDRIDLLKPRIDKNNGYRYYSYKEMEILDFILDGKYLEIPLSDIKEVIGKSSIQSQFDLIDLQEKAIEQKIRHLEKIKKNAQEKKDILKEIISFKNINDFETIKVEKQEITVLLIPIDYINNNKIKQKDTSTRNMYIEEWLFLYNINENNTLIENEKYIAIDIKNIGNLEIPSNLNISEKNYKGDFIKVKFYGSMKDIENYTLDLVNHFYKGKKAINLDIIVKYIWNVYMEEESKYFVKIIVPINKKI